MAQTFERSAQGGWNSQGSGYRLLKPKKDMPRIKGQSADSLMLELAQFEIDLGKLGVSVRSEAAYRHLRSCVADRAREIVDLEMVTGLGRGPRDLLNSPLRRS